MTNSQLFWNMFLFIDDYHVSCFLSLLFQFTIFRQNFTYVSCVYNKFFFFLLRFRFLFLWWERYEVRRWDERKITCEYWTKKNWVLYLVVQKKDFRVLYIYHFISLLWSISSLLLNSRIGNRIVKIFDCLKTLAIWSTDIHHFKSKDS